VSFVPSIGVRERLQYLADLIFTLFFGLGLLMGFLLYYSFIGLPMLFFGWIIVTGSSIKRCVHNV
jgi:hypothetical protein